MKSSLQEYADDLVAPEYRQPLKTVREACEAVGWEFLDSPTCCGNHVTTHALFGVYHAECKTCGRFIRDMSAPIMRNSYASVIDSDKVDLDTAKSWITGVCPVDQRIGDA